MAIVFSLVTSHTPRKPTARAQHADGTQSRDILIRFTTIEKLQHHPIKGKMTRLKLTKIIYFRKGAAAQLIDKRAYPLPKSPWYSTFLSLTLTDSPELLAANQCHDRPENFDDEELDPTVGRKIYSKGVSDGNAVNGIGREYDRCVKGFATIYFTSKGICRELSHRTRLRYRLLLAASS